MWAAAALSAIKSVACRVPIAVGVKVRLMEQKTLLPSETGQVLFWRKSPALAPEIVMAFGGASSKAWLPLFPSLSTIVLLVALITTVPKPSCVESNTGIGPEIPVRL